MISVASASLAVIINPISGTRGRADVVRARAAQAAAFIGLRGGDPTCVFLSERPGHARELAAAAVARGISTVVAWGGDGTMNEVGSALAFTNASLGIVPSGSGNGLARELGIPFDPAAALEIASAGRELVIDAGEIDGRLFFNLAGIGLDARVAHRFAAHVLQRRGFARYMSITVRELLAYTPDRLTITTATSSVSTPVLLVAIANGRQYGNGAIIAPQARLDDGKLDVVIITNRSAPRALIEIPFVFLGLAGKVGGVTMEATESVRITSPEPVLFHVDGEPITGVRVLHARARPRALKIKVPAPG